MSLTEEQKKALLGLLEEWGDFMLAPEAEPEDAQGLWMEIVDILVEK